MGLATKGNMSKELRFHEPDKNYPERFALKALLDNPKPDDLLEIYIDWKFGSPVVVIRVSE